MIGNSPASFQLLVAARGLGRSGLLGSGPDRLIVGASHHVQFGSDTIAAGLGGEADVRSALTNASHYNSRAFLKSSRTPAKQESHRAKTTVSPENIVLPFASRDR